MIIFIDSRHTRCPVCPPLELVDRGDPVDASVTRALLALAGAEELCEGVQVQQVAAAEMDKGGVQPARQADGGDRQQCWPPKVGGAEEDDGGEV